MMYLVVADWNDDNIVIAENRTDDEVQAAEFVESMKGEGYTEAFYVNMPSGEIGPLVVDPVAKTVTRDADIGNATILAKNWKMLRRERNTKLVDSDWTQYNDSPLTDEVKAEWAVHRQALRDLPANTDDPADPTWPTPPG